MAGMDVMEKLAGRRRVERAAAGGGVALALTLALWPSHWPFDARLPGRDVSVGQLVLSDRLTLGFVRLSLVLLSLFVIASVPALFAAGRWLRGFGTAGVTADDTLVPHLQRELERLQEHIDHLTAERDEALRRLALSDSDDAIADPSGESR
jgi:hypothetical protein